MGKRITHEQFIGSISEIGVTALEKYVNSRTKILVSCNKCGLIFRTKACLKIKGNRCPECRRISRINNIIEYHADWLLVDVSTETFPTATMAIDTDIFATHVSLGRGRIFASTSSASYIYAEYSSNGKAIRIHRDIIKTDKCIDHKCHGTLEFIDNRRSNLREVTYSQNQMNKKVKSNNTSGCTGVYFSKNNKSWVASIKHNKNAIHIGSFKIKEDAVSARKAAEKKYFGEYSYSKNNTETKSCAII